MTAAAAALHLTPSAVSQQLRVLSRALGVPLTERDGRRVRLTAQAALVLRETEAIDAQLERVRAELAAFAEGRAGAVSIGTFASAVQPIVIAALRSLKRERPNLEVSITEVEAPLGFLALERGEVDVLITVEYAGGPTRTDSRFERVGLVRDPLLAVLPNTHPLARKQGPVRLQDLADDRWVIGTVGHPCVDATTAAQSLAGFTANVVHRTDDWPTTAAIVAGCGAVALIPKLALRTVPRRGFVVRDLAQPTARNIYAATRAGSASAPHIAAALSALVGAAAK